MPCFCASSTVPFTAAPLGIATSPSTSTAVVITPVNGSPSLFTRELSASVKVTVTEVPVGTTNGGFGAGGGAACFIAIASPFGAIAGPLLPEPPALASGVPVELFVASVADLLHPAIASNPASVSIINFVFIIPPFGHFHRAY